MTTPLPATAAEPLARRAARERAWALLRDSQLGEELTAEMVRELIADATARHWHDVVLIGRYLAFFCARYIDLESGAPELAALHEQASTDGDDVMLALALGCRAQELGHDGRTLADGDRDLARAIVLLDGFEGRSTEAVCARIECGYAFGERELWDEQLRQYELAGECLDPDECAEDYREVLALNRAQTEVYRLMALREAGPGPQLAACAEIARTVVQSARALRPPRIWDEEMLMFEVLVDAISAPAGDPAALDHVPDRGPCPYIGYVHLARAFHEPDRRRAHAHCERAIAAPDPDGSERVRTLALALAVELEAQTGAAPLGLRWGRELTAGRARRRVRTRASIESLVAAQRAAADRAELEQHAHRDALTGLANRRALERTIASLCERGVDSIAVALLDLDGLKAINDAHGHALGDRVLADVADILRAHLRERDFVARLGGDEFIILLDGLDEAAARRRLHAIVTAVSAADWSRRAPGLVVATSAGVATGSPERFADVCAAADAALYVDKRARQRRS